MQAKQLRATLDAGMATLQTFYSPGDGQWNTVGWWNAANALNTVIQYTQRTGSSLYLGDIPQTFAAAQTINPGFVDTAYDDNGWWALTWVDAYDLTGEKRYLDMARSLFEVNTQAWTDVCSGGLVWETTNSYKETVANELFLALAAALYLRTGAGHYLHWARREWDWFRATGLINSEHLVNDGLTSACQNNGETTWTYNQGVILGGLASMYEITGDRAYLDAGDRIADAVMSDLTSGGILAEPYSASDPASNPDTDPNVIQFKGVFIRNLYQFSLQSQRPAYGRFILRNAESICAHDLGASDQFGYLWQGPVDAFDSPYLAGIQSSALDALTSAIGVLTGPSQPLVPQPPAYPPGTNLVTNPSGAGGTAGWYLAYGGQDATLTSTTYGGAPALYWTVGAIGHEDWISYYPAVQNGQRYTFSVQVAGSGTIALEIWTGTADILSLPVDLTSSYQTVTWTATIPGDAPGGQSGSAPQFQLATLGTAPVSVYFQNASVVAISPQ